MPESNEDRIARKNEERAKRNLPLKEKFQNFAKDVFYRQKLGPFGFNVLSFIIYFIIGTNLIFMINTKLHTDSFIPLDKEKAPYCCKKGDRWSNTGPTQESDDLEASLGKIWNLDYGAPYTLADSEEPPQPLIPTISAQILWFIQYWIWTVKKTMGECFRSGWLYSRKVAKIPLEFIKGLITKKTETGNIVENEGAVGAIIAFLGFFLVSLTFMSGSWIFISALCFFVGSFNVGLGNWFLSALLLVLTFILPIICLFMGVFQTGLGIILLTIFPLAMHKGRKHILQRLLQYSKMLLLMVAFASLISLYDNLGWEYALGGIISMLILGVGDHAVKMYKDNKNN